MINKFLHILLLSSNIKSTFSSYILLFFKWNIQSSIFANLSVHMTYQIQLSMGGSQSNVIEVEEIPKSKIINKSPPHSRSPKLNKSPAKVIIPNHKKHESEFTQAETFGGKKSSVTLPQSHGLSENTSDSRSKKKIKSVKQLPMGLERHPVIEDMQDLKNSGKYSEHKPKNEKMELQKLMRIYDLV